MSKRMLVVDDEPAIRDILSHTFTMAGYVVQTADSGFAALAILADDTVVPPSAIIVGDLSPRPETSLGLVNDIAVAFTGQRVPILMLSTQVTPSDITCGLANGASAYVAKPFALSTLLTTVEELITSATT